MKVLHLISSEGYYGAESMLLTLVTALAPLQCGCRVAVFRDRRRPNMDLAERARQQGVPVDVVACAGRWDRHALKAIRALIDRQESDVLHTHGYKADVYGYLAARTTPAALVSTCHNWAAPGFAMRLYGWLDRLILHRFDRVAAVSDSVLEILRDSGVGRAKRLINGVDLQRFHPGPASRRPFDDRFDRLVGFVGRLVPKKGGDLLVRAARKVIDVYPNTGFVFVGEGPARSSWEELARQLEIADNILFPGRRDDIESIYPCLDVVVLPSRLEAMPMCLLEAMAAGVPTVATKVGGVSAFVVPAVTGLLVESEDVDGISHSVMSLFKDPELAASIAQCARSEVERLYSSEAMARQYHALYREALQCQTN